MFRDNSAESNGKVLNKEVRMEFEVRTKDDHEKKTHAKNESTYGFYQ